ISSSESSLVTSRSTNVRDDTTTQKRSTTMPATVTTAPSSASAGSRSLRKTMPRGTANSGAVDDSTLATATPAYFTEALYMTELTAVSAASASSRTNNGQPPRSSAGTPRSAHGVTQSITAPTGRRIACALTGSIPSSGPRSATTDTPHASAASSASTTPRHGRGSPGGSTRAMTISPRPASVSRPPTTIGALSRSPRSSAASDAATTG